MRIGINLLFLKPQNTGGIQTYSECLLYAFEKLKKTDQVIFIFCNSTASLPRLKQNTSFNIIRYRFIGKSVLYRYFFEQFIFPFKLRKYKLDLLHSMGYVGPVFLKNHVVTIHDTNAFAHKEMPWLKKIFLSIFLKLTAHNCTHIITVSEFSKNEIIKYLKVPVEKISVIYEASKFEKIQTTYSLPYKFNGLSGIKYFVGLGSVTKNKNIQTLVLAFEKILRKNPDARLVLIGYMPADNSIMDLINKKNLSPEVIFTGYINDEELIAFFQHAACFVFPSLYEGFGLPLLEAQALGVPVIAANKTSLPEVAGNGAIYFNAEDADELAQVMQQTIDNDARVNHYKQLGFENCKRFSWDKAATETLQVYSQFSN